MSLKKRINLSTATTHNEEMLFIKEAFDTNWVAPLGKNVDELEKEIASYVGVKHGAALSAGTAAIHLAVKLAGVKEGDIVFCSDLTFSATANPVSYEKAEQVFIDSERDTWNMCPIALEKAFKKYEAMGKLPKAVILVHLYGVPAKLDEICDLCNKYGAVLIEDAAESLGALYKGKQTGSFGKYNILSFNGNKIITASGGGMLISDDGEAISKAKFWATQSRDPAPHYQHSEIGYNYRMSNICAGIGRGQFIHLGEHIAAKRRLYEIYRQELKDLPISLNPCMDCSSSNYWLSCILIDSGCSVKPYDIMNRLMEENIESRPIWKPMHMQPIFAGKDYITSEEGLSVDEDIFSRGLCLPSEIKMDDQDIKRVVSTIRSSF